MNLEKIRHNGNDFMLFDTVDYQHGNDGIDYGGGWVFCWKLCG